MSKEMETRSDDLYATVSYCGGGGGGNQWGNLAETTCIAVSGAVGTAMGAAAGTAIAPGPGTAIGDATGGIAGTALGAIACDSLNGVNDYPGGMSIPTS